jgi:hypothetical protein
MTLRSSDVIDGLTKIGAYDPKFPIPAAIVVEAWLEHFEQYPALERDDLLDAIKVYYRKPGVDVPRPADISSIAREQRRDRNSRWTDEDMARYEALCDSKAADHEPRQIANPNPSTAESRRKAIESFAKDRFLPSDKPSGDPAPHPGMDTTGEPVSKA